MKPGEKKQHIEHHNFMVKSNHDASKYFVYLQKNNFGLGSKTTPIHTINTIQKHVLPKPNISIV